MLCDCVFEKVTPHPVIITQSPMMVEIHLKLTTPSAPSSLIPHPLNSTQDPRSGTITEDTNAMRLSLQVRQKSSTKSRRALIEAKEPYHLWKSPTFRSRCRRGKRALLKAKEPR